MTPEELAKLSPEEKRVKIAEHCPKIARVLDNGRTEWIDSCIYFDPLNDLNAMHEAEKMLGPGATDWYIEQLGQIVREYYVSKGKKPECLGQRDVIFAHAHATATQRADAFLLTVLPWN